LLKHFEKFFAFLRNQGVEPTNNSAERALRYAVQWRRVRFGSRSAQGEIAVARLLTVTRICRMQNREPLDYLGTAIRSHRKVQPVPSLLKIAPERLFRSSAGISGSNRGGSLTVAQNDAQQWLYLTG
jgi:hypothetical protein